MAVIVPLNEGLLTLAAFLWGESLSVYARASEAR